MTASAISHITSIFRVRVPLGPIDPRPATVITRENAAPVVARAGTRPNRTLVASAMAAANARTRQSMPTSASRGMLAGPSATSAPVAPHATARPASAPADPSTRLSASNGATSRPRPAPTAVAAAAGRRRRRARDADHFIGVAVHPQDRSDDVRPRAELPAPEPVADDHDVSALVDVGLLDGATVSRHHAEHREKPGGHV